MAVTLAAAALAGCGSRSTSSSAIPSEVKIEVTDDGFVPPLAYIPRARPFILLVTRTSDATCATAMVFERTRQKFLLPLDQTVRIELPAASEDTVKYTCSMGMVRGALVAK